MPKPIVNNVNILSNPVYVKQYHILHPAILLFDRINFIAFTRSIKYKYVNAFELILKLSSIKTPCKRVHCYSIYILYIIILKKKKKLISSYVQNDIDPKHKYPILTLYNYISCIFK